MERFVGATGAKGAASTSYAASSTVLTFIATQRAAAHLVNTKLRTEYGSATQTFAQLERMLQVGGGVGAEQEPTRQAAAYMRGHQRRAI